MIANSINTNAGAMIALQNLNATNSELTTTQQRINTGKKISNAKDNGAIWSMAEMQSATSSSLNAVKDSLQRGQSTIDVALAAGDTVTDLLGKMKEKALAASDTSLNTASFNALKADFESLRDQIAKAASNAKLCGAVMTEPFVDQSVVSSSAMNAIKSSFLSSSILKISLTKIQNHKYTWHLEHHTHFVTSQQCTHTQPDA